MRLPARTLLVLVPLVLAGPAPLAAAEAPAAPPANLQATWIAPEALALQRVLPPPPAAGSRAEEADLAAVRVAVAARTAEDERRIAADLPCTLDRFTDALGPAYTAARMPRLARLIERVFQDGELAVLAAKAAIGRRRPYTLDPGLRTFGHRSDSTSYPSGHTAFGFLAATVLATIAPDRRDALFARAARYGRNREEAGTHFPTDLEGGKIAAAVIAEALLRDAGFRHALEEAAAEARQAAGAAP